MISALTLPHFDAPCGDEVLNLKVLLEHNLGPAYIRLAQVTNMEIVAAQLIN